LLALRSGTGLNPYIELINKVAKSALLAKTPPVSIWLMVFPAEPRYDPNHANPDN
jgi:hypothetical protein